MAILSHILPKTLTVPKYFVEGDHWPRHYSKTSLFQGHSRESSAHLQEGVADSRYAVLRGVSCCHQSPEDLYQLGYHLEGRHSLVWAFLLILSTVSSIPSPLPIFARPGACPFTSPPFESA
jgi:hypothetical protein